MLKFVGFWLSLGCGFLGVCVSVGLVRCLVFSKWRSWNVVAIAMAVALPYGLAGGPSGWFDGLLVFVCALGLTAGLALVLASPSLLDWIKTADRRVRNRWWLWEHRCAHEQLLDQYTPPAAALDWLARRAACYERCPVCGSRCCRWAPVKKARRYGSR
jgi:hypothetical protein